MEIEKLKELREALRRAISMDAEISEHEIFDALVLLTSCEAASVIADAIKEWKDTVDELEKANDKLQKRIVEMKLAIADRVLEGGMPWLH